MNIKLKWSLPENLYIAAHRMSELNPMNVSLGINRLMFLFSKGAKAINGMH